MALRLGIVLLISLFVAACGQEARQGVAVPPRPVRVFQVVDGNLVAGRAFPGQARSAREAMLAFRIGGRIKERRVKSGDQVQEGDLLATLDAATYQLEFDRVTANLQRARTAYSNAANQVNRHKPLVAQGYYQVARFENLESEAAQAQSEVKSLEAAQARAKLDLSYTELRAPFSGIVSAVFAETFEEIKPQQSVIRLIDPAETEMVVSVPESVISYVPHVVDLIVTFDAFPGVEIPAEVSEIGSEPSETTRTYTVKLLLTPPPGMAILPGMAGQVRGKPSPDIAAQFNGVVIPLSAVFSPDDAKGSFVWVVDAEGKTVHRQQVTLGEPVIGGVSVTEGLALGSLVVEAGVHSLREGQAIRVLEP